MALLDFKEIPESNKATGEQDSFELFARDALDSMRFVVIQGPARGADGGKDLVVEEIRGGVVANTKISWLVSCKHFAFSGRSVRPDDEKNVLERVKAAKCDGFLGFYSTLPSNGLSDLLGKQTIPVKLFDHEEIERHLLATPTGRRLVERYFPTSATKLAPKPAQIFDNLEPITCDYCGKNLLKPPSGVWVLWESFDRTDSEKGSDNYVDFHFACKGKCDRILQGRIREKHGPRGSVIDGWDDIPDLTIPTVYIRKVMAFMNGLARGDRFEPPVFDKLKHLLLATFPHVSRHLTDKDREEIGRLMSIPPWAGGMG